MQALVEFHFILRHLVVIKADNTYLMVKAIRFIGRQKDINGTVWYNLGNRDTQWVSADSFVLSKTGNYATEKAYGRLQINGNVNVMSGPGGTGSSIT